MLPVGIPIRGYGKILPTHVHAPMCGHMTYDVTQLPVVNKARRKTKRMENISGNSAQNSQTMVPITGQGKDHGYLRVFCLKMTFLCPERHRKSPK